MPNLLSLFDHSGEWSKPYREAGWQVVQVDIKHGIDILKFDYKSFDCFHGILAAPPCTDFSLSGAQYWKAKDADGRTDYSVSLVRKALEIKEYFNPVFFALENPLGRIQKCVPELGNPAYWFHPSDYGENYTKRSYLWGRFVPPMPLFTGGAIGIPVPVQENFIMKLGGKSERTKELRSVTPPGFAKAFYLSNNGATQQSVHPTGARLREKSVLVNKFVVLRSRPCG